MKICPHCGAENDDLTNVCPICNEFIGETTPAPAHTPPQNNQLLILLIILICVAVIIGGIGLAMFALSNNDDELSDKNEIIIYQTVTEAPVTAFTENNTTQTHEDRFEQHENTRPESTSSSTRMRTTKTTTTTAPVTTTTKIVVTAGVTLPTTPAYAANREETYSYRFPERDEVYATLNYVLPDDVITITGVLTPSADGVYYIPNTIDGKRVIAISSHAFAGEDVKAIILAENVSSINDYAFSACPNLSDIYFYDNTYIDTATFAPLEERHVMLNIHCPFNCHNRNFCNYHNIASTWFDANYYEWDQGDPIAGFN